VRATFRGLGGKGAVKEGGSTLLKENKKTGCLPHRKWKKILSVGQGKEHSLWKLQFITGRSPKDFRMTKETHVKNLKGGLGGGGGGNIKSCLRNLQFY